jgi:hypothetical protein
MAGMSLRVQTQPRDPKVKQLIHSFQTVLALPLLEKTFVSLLQIRDRAMVT